MYSTDDIQFINQKVAGLNTRIAMLGEGPTVLFVHGWPESWYSWRWQMVALANAGYRAVAPDMPGYGETEGWSDWQDYNILNVSDFLLELIDIVAEKPVILVGHDWGAVHSWNFTLRHPEAVSLLSTMSVPLRSHSSEPPMTLYRKKFQDIFFYQLYFQEMGTAEAEFDANPYGILSRLLTSPDTPRETPKVGKIRSDGQGWIDRLGEPKEMPGWLSEDELNYYVEAFKKSGFAGGIHYYRNIDKTWEVMAPYADKKIDCPVLFIAGSADNTILRANKQQLEDLMKPRVPDLTVELYEGLGHWIQNEAAERVNTDLMQFLNKNRSP